MPNKLFIFCTDSHCIFYKSCQFTSDQLYNHCLKVKCVNYMFVLVVIPLITPSLRQGRSSQPGARTHDGRGALLWAIAALLISMWMAHARRIWMIEEVDFYLISLKISLLTPFTSPVRQYQFFVVFASRFLLTQLDHQSCTSLFCKLFVQVSFSLAKIWITRIILNMFIRMHPNTH